MTLSKYIIASSPFRCSGNVSTEPPFNNGCPLQFFIYGLRIVYYNIKRELYLWECDRIFKGEFYMSQFLCLKKIGFSEMITYIIDVRFYLLWIYQRYFIIMLSTYFKVKFLRYTS
jgi:hypothetical protein